MHVDVNVRWDVCRFKSVFECARLGVLERSPAGRTQQGTWTFPKRGSWAQGHLGDGPAPTLRFLGLDPSPSLSARQSGSFSPGFQQFSFYWTASQACGGRNDFLSKKEGRWLWRLNLSAKIR